jgi:hypothetical protein
VEYIVIPVSKYARIITDPIGPVSATFWFYLDAQLSAPLLRAARVGGAVTVSIDPETDEIFPVDEYPDDYPAPETATARLVDLGDIVGWALDHGYLQQADQQAGKP